MSPFILFLTYNGSSSDIRNIQCLSHIWQRQVWTVYIVCQYIKYVLCTERKNIQRLRFLFVLYFLYFFVYINIIIMNKIRYFIIFVV